MTFIRKNTLPKGAFLLVQDNQKTPKGFSYAPSLNEFVADFTSDNVIKFESADTDIVFYNELSGIGEVDAGANRIDVSILVETGQVDGTVEAIHKRARTGGGIQRIPVVLAALYLIDGSGDALPHNERVYFNIGIVSTSEGVDISGDSSVGDVLSGFDTSLAYFHLSIADAGYNGMWLSKNLQSPQLTLKEQGDVKQNINIDYFPTGDIYNPQDDPVINLLVDLDARRIAIEFEVDGSYRLSDWLDMRTDWPYKIRSHFYIKMYAENRMFGSIYINQFETNLIESGERVKTDGYFMKQSPLLVIKK